MANAIRIKGFYPLTSWHGHFSVRPYAVLSGNSRIITKGDTVALVADGGATEGAGASGWQAVTRGQASDGDGGTSSLPLLVGVASHCFYTDAGNINRPSARIPASQAGTVYVFDDPFTEFVGAARDLAIVSQLSDLNAGADIYDSTAAVSIPTTQGSFGGISQQSLNLASLSATTSANFRLLGKYAVADNAFGSSTTDNLHGQYVVLFNEHAYRTSTTFI